LRCARDKANIIVAAKTTEPHPKLPGTIYTAAEESKFLTTKKKFFTLFFLSLFSRKSWWKMFTMCC
jgi:hypothetical protein